VLHCDAGHTDVVMGAVILNDDDVAARLRFLQNGMHLTQLFHLHLRVQCLSVMLCAEYATFRNSSCE